MLSQAIPNFHFLRYINYFIGYTQIISPGPRLSLKTICIMMRFHGQELLAPRPTPTLADHPFSNFRDCLFNIRSYSTYQSPFLQPQPENMPFRGDMDYKHTRTSVIWNAANVKKLVPICNEATETSPMDRSPPQTSSNY
jgi:hypothetical protein